MLVIADRGFYSYRLWQAAAASGADLLWRMQDGPNLPVVRAFPDGSYESFLLDPKVRGRRANQRHRGSANIEEPSGIPVRVIEYEVTNREGKGRDLLPDHHDHGSGGRECRRAGRRLPGTLGIRVEPG